VKKPYIVYMHNTVSVAVEVDAHDEEEAIEIAEMVGLPTLEMPDRKHLYQSGWSASEAEEIL
jgi:hypothetical protein